MHGTGRTGRRDRERVDADEAYTAPHERPCRLDTKRAATERRPTGPQQNACRALRQAGELVDIDRVAGRGDIEDNGRSDARLQWQRVHRRRQPADGGTGVTAQRREMAEGERIKIEGGKATDGAERLRPIGGDETRRR